ncbi:anti-sigma factor [Gemmatimonas sp.]|uniref:anti-sigma factor family protein n=1 Tax=Gemmatimonas sp. TaxID=1962908 RepID=UPI0027B946C3|nr:zf-HC2 domain-containing protein [Gemmatimonas sp.]
MDCKHFRKRHLAYLDDTLPGELMAEAQRHVLVCDGCAAHDALVRRSLMVVHTMAPAMPSLEPSAEFQTRLRARLAECRAERTAAVAGTLGEPTMPPVARNRFVSPSRTMLAMAASAAIGALAFQAVRSRTAPTLAMQPVMVMLPAPVARAPYSNPDLMQAMATGNPVWPATMIVEEAPAGFVNAPIRFADVR